MMLESLKNYLDNYQVKFVVISHAPAYTAQGVAGLMHIPGKELAKTIIVRLDRELVMCVLPANFHVDLGILKEATHAHAATLATEEDFRDWFPQCETGAMPPFGNLYGLRVYADRSLEQDIEIVFNAGTHRELIRMNWEDYKRLVDPIVMGFATENAAEAA